MRTIYTFLVVLSFSVLMLTGDSSAGTITCGGCHGTPASQDPLPNNPDNCNNNARGLHGTHVNYSSATYKKTVAYNGKCAYCHTAVSDTKGISSTYHINNYINITSYNSGGINSTGLREVARTCTNACHRNAASTAPWGNYTTSNVKLSCVACHADSSNTAGFSGNHAKHFCNTTTPGGYGLMSAANNAGCKNCHPDNVNDFWSAANRLDDGTKKAYPHASDGTNVQSVNAAMTANVSAITGGAGATATCTNACHSRVTTVTWGQAVDCNMCHYWALSPLDTNNVGTGSLGGAHSSHFKAGVQFPCTQCHPDHSAETTKLANGHARKLPAQSGYALVMRAGMTWDSVAKTCTNTGNSCHGNSGATASWYPCCSTGCATCHYYPGATLGLGDSWPAGNGHASGIRHDAPVVNTHMKATGFNYQTDTFAAVVADTGKCGLCHRNTTHRNGSGFAHLSSATGSTYSQCGTTPFTFSSGGVGNRSLVTCNNVKCHSGKTTPNWW